MEIGFYGAVGTVTGSKYLLKTAHHQFMVDCGLFQGMKELRSRNWKTLPFNPNSISAVILTHAHIDHSGYLPLLVKNGFSGKIYCSPATLDLCQILLPDSAHLQEEEALRANRFGYSKHHPALPLYTIEDANRALEHFVAVPFGKEFSLTDDCHFRLQHAGHILGASTVRVEAELTSILFSGDVGRTHDMIMKPPTIIDPVDYLVLESTYGNRLHSEENPLDQMCEIVNRVSERGGVLLIPAFAVGRAQNVLYYLYTLKQKGLIPDLPIYLDSPMAISATELFARYDNEHHLSHNLAKAVCESATYVNTVEESKALAKITTPMIIISASGMVEGGRVLHHLQNLASDPRNCILLTGYQAAGTRGARLLAAEPRIKLFGQEIAIAAEVCELVNASAHADYAEIIEWLKKCPKAPRKVFIAHGEKEAALAMQEHVMDELGWDAEIPTYGQLYTL